MSAECALLRDKARTAVCERDSKSLGLVPVPGPGPTREVRMRRCSLLSDSSGMDFTEYRDCEDSSHAGSCFLSSAEVSMLCICKVSKQCKNHMNFMQIKIIINANSVCVLITVENSMEICCFIF